MEREKFEESWKDAFERAEVTPSENVWTNIELDLEKARGGELKKRLMFYKMLAAASVVLAMAIGGVGYYYSFTSGSDTIAENTDTPVRQEQSEHQAQTELNTTPQADIHKPQPSPLRAEDERSPLTSNNERAATSPAKAREQRSEDLTRKGIAGNDPGFKRNGIASVTTASGMESGDKTSIAGPASAERGEEYPMSVKDKEVSALYTRREVRLNLEKKEPDVDPVIKMLAMLEQREREVQGEEADKKKSRSVDENLWTSVGFAAGSFNQNQSSSPGRPSTMNPASMALAAPIVDQESKATGYSYTMGVNVGTKLSERWVFQGGVNYLTNSSQYTANNMVMEPMGKFEQQRFRAASTSDLVNADEHELSNKLVYTAPYNVNNNMRYLSIPMQAGYLLVNKTFGLQLNAGVATDLFLQNTVEAESDQLAKTSQPSGADSPYRAVNLSGLFGTEFSYRFGSHYRVSLNPGIRYPFNTIYKSELGVQSTPLTFDVGLRFRYIFK